MSILSINLDQRPLIPSEADELCWNIVNQMEAAEISTSGAQFSLPSMREMIQSQKDEYAVYLSMFIRSRMDSVDRNIDLSRSSVVGNLNPDILLVGEQHSGDHPEYRSCFGPWSGCGPFLLRAILPHHGRIAMCNALEEPDIGSLISLMSDPHICSLGKKADSVLTDMRIQHGTVPHPQYVRRFLNKHLDQYGDVIIQAATQSDDRSAWRGHS